MEVIEENANLRRLMNKQFEKGLRYRDKLLKKDFANRQKLFNDITQSHKSFKILKKNNEEKQKQEKTFELKTKIFQLKTETSRNKEEFKELKRKERELLSDFKSTNVQYNTFR